jgi:redox-sensitive bicupin YhaK (pirin superfamily)
MRVAEAGRALVLEGEGSVLLVAGEAGARCLLIAAQPIGEPVVQYGPFVMNTTAEIEQALADYRAGTLTD